MEKPATIRFGLLDASRGLAALGVVMYHAGFWPHMAWYWGAMDFFFVMSGVLISRTLIINQARGHTYGAFLVYRASRLYPVMLALLLGYEALVLVLDNTVGLAHRDSLDTLPYLLLYHNLDLVVGPEKTLPFLYDLMHFWSLILEEHFYIIWGILFFTFPMAFRKIDLRFLICAGLLLLVPMYLRSEGMHYWVLPARFDGFLVGSILGIILFQPGSVQISERTKSILLKIFWVCVGLSIIRLIDSALFSYEDLVAYENHVTVWLDVTCYTLVSAAAIVGILKYDQSGRDFGRVQAALSWVGLVSYELYVVHFPISRILLRFVDRDSFTGPLMVLIATLALSLPLAWLLHKTLTAPALRNRHKVISYFGLVKQPKQEKA